MSRSDTTAFDVEEGLLALPGAPERWIWAFTCPTPNCACRAAVVVSAEGDRESVRERGRSVAAAWRARGQHGAVAAALTDAVSFAVDLDTLDVFPSVGDAPLNLGEHPAIKAVTDRLDDELLDRMARLWHRGKGQSPPSAPGEAATIAVEGWAQGGLVAWDEAQPSLRADIYVAGERVFGAIELYCVEPDCACAQAIVDFSPLAPRGTPELGRVELDGALATLRPAHERYREALSQLWNAYCARHSNHLARIARRRAIMHGLAGRVVSAPRAQPIGRNDACHCGSGKKYKKCCGAA